MAKEFEVRWERELPASPEQVWDAITVHSDGWLWKIDYEPWVGGAERTRAGAPGDDDFNQLEYRLAARGTGSHVRYVHSGVLTGDYDLELDACRQHTAFYAHSMSEYVSHFAGRRAACVAGDAPAASASGGFAVLRQALGLPGAVAVGDRVRLAPAGLAPVEGVLDYSTHAFLGIRGADALYRFYGRDPWGWPVAVGHHLFAAGTDAAAHAAAWQAWLDGVFATEAVAR